jgi:energy-converting hydrogenase Eha subunit E
MTLKEGKFSRRTIALFWLLLVGIVIGFLIYWEQIALLYVIATIGLVILLLIVGFADLENVGRENAEVFSAEDR